MAALTSELEAVNILLAAINEAPAATLNDSGIPYLAAAYACLTEISRSVQTVGWHFNTEDDYPLVLDSNGFLPLPSDTLKVVADDRDHVQRGAFLYDKANHTKVFAKPQSVTIVRLLPWDDLPQAARNYITIRAARIFQTRELGSESQFRFSEYDEQVALKVIQEAEAETGQYNYFTDSQSVASII